MTMQQPSPEQTPVGSREKNGAMTRMSSPGVCVLSPAEEERLAAYDDMDVVAPFGWRGRSDDILVIPGRLCFEPAPRRTPCGVRRHGCRRSL
ncbi:MAG: hypothetical protein K2L75_01155, partial [Muribaculaceae bacterium]|nr:hypothetical protein [Muribaculaceae bacterium]